MPAAPASILRRVVRCSLLIVTFLALALGVDLVRQASATDRVAWRDLPALNESSSPTDTLAPADPTTPNPADPAANPSSRPTLLRFTAENCGPCRMMVVDVFSDRASAQLIEERTRPISVDITQPTGPALAAARQYRVIYTPTLILLGPDGREWARLDRAVDAEAFQDWLTSALNAHPRGG